MTTDRRSKGAVMGLWTATAILLTVAAVALDLLLAPFLDGLG